MSALRPNRILASAIIGCLCFSGCGGGPPVREGEMAPYKAVVVFAWPDGIERPATPDEPAADVESSGGSASQEEESGSVRPSEPGTAGDPVADARARQDSPRGRLSRREVEDGIIKGLEEYQVFSDFVVADPKDMSRAAEAEHADLIVLIFIGDLVRWDSSAARTVSDMAVLEGFLWFCTGVGSWWIPETAFPTNSEVELAWKRAADAGSAAAASGDVRSQFKLGERLSTAEYRLSFWDRAKPWNYPWAYLMSIVMPPVFIPVKDSDDAKISLERTALEEIRREVARKLRGGYLGAAGAPFLFRIEQPHNGTVVGGGSVKLRFRYRVEPGFEEHDATGLSALSIEVKRAGSETYELWRRFDDADIRTINAKNSAGQPLEEEVRGLERGANLIRFVGRTEFENLWITNTIAIQRE